MINKIKTSIYCLLVINCFTIAVFAANKTTFKNKQVITFHTQKNQIKINARVAKTQKQRSKGLMFVDSLKHNEGMLFVFERPQYNTFWMRNTLIPLDLIFINQELKIVGIIKNTAPHSTKHLSVAKKSLYIVEVNGGFTHKNNIKVGDKISFKN